jgi:ribosomal protein L40E
MVSSKLYKEIQSYVTATAFKMLRNANFEALEIVHNIILDDDFCEDDWIKLVPKYIYAIIKDNAEKKQYENHVLRNEKSAEEITICRGCNNELPIRYFDLSKKLCRKCYYKKHKDKINAQCNEWKRRNKDKIEPYQKMYRAKYRTENIAYMKEYHKKNQKSRANLDLKTKSKTGYFGVQFQAGKFRARIKFKGKLMNLGYFETAIEAAAAYNEKAIELFGESKRINKI